MVELPLVGSGLIRFWAMLLSSIGWIRLLIVDQSSRRLHRSARFGGHLLRYRQLPGSTEPAALAGAASAIGRKCDLISNVAVDVILRLPRS